MSKYDLDVKGIDTENLAKNALTDEGLMTELMDGILSKDNTTRLNSFQVLQKISEDEPKFLYPHWDYFQKMLLGKNNYHCYIAIYLLANLTAVDMENKFEKIFDQYYGILESDKAMTASHVALNSSKIALNKPELQTAVIDRLLNIDQIHHGKQKEIVKAYAIEALRKIYPHVKDKQKIE
ncbi:MAG TPA: hypothetical protein VK444_03780, partial [Methanobacteriaceae archaeon]|nr:hypothetical protein [Methanobacteriaceae archaeon]